MAPEKHLENLTRIMLRLEDSLLEEIETYRNRVAADTGIRPNRTEAIRALLRVGLAQAEIAARDLPTDHKKFREQIEALPLEERPQAILKLLDALSNLIRENVEKQNKRDTAKPSRRRKKR